MTIHIWNCLSYMWFIHTEYWSCLDCTTYKNVLAKYKEYINSSIATMLYRNRLWAATVRPYNVQCKKFIQTFLTRAGVLSLPLESFDCSIFLSTFKYDQTHQFRINELPYIDNFLLMIYYAEIISLFLMLNLDKCMTTVVLKDAFLGRIFTRCTINSPFVIIKH